MLDQFARRAFRMLSFFHGARGHCKIKSERPEEFDAPRRGGGKDDARLFR
jgi:hypothetical protein